MRIIFIILGIASLCCSLQISPVVIANAKIMRLLHDGMKHELRGGACMKRSRSSSFVLNDKEKTQYAMLPIHESVNDVLLYDDHDESQDASSPSTSASATTSASPAHDAVDTFEDSSSFFDEANIADNSAVWYAAGMVLGGSTAFM